MRVYLSAKFERQKEMQLYSEQLRAEGIEVVSTWTDLDVASRDGFSGIAPERRALAAMLDVQQLVRSNLLVLFSDGDAADPRGGKHVEFGIGLALGKRLMLVGRQENVFHDLPDVERCDDWPQTLRRVLELRDSDALSVSQAAREANVTCADVLYWIKSNRLPAVKDTRGRWVIGRNDLDQVKASRCRRAAEKASR